MHAYMRARMCDCVAHICERQNKGGILLMKNLLAQWQSSYLLDQLLAKNAQSGVDRWHICSSEMQSF